MAAIDCGIKLNILRRLREKGCDVTVVPWDTSGAAIMELHPDGVFLSNGPGPQDSDYLFDAFLQMMEDEAYAQKN